MRGPTKTTTRWCALLLVLLPGLQQTYAQTIKPAPVSLEFEKKIPNWLKETNVPAAAVGIIENGKLKYTKVFGELRKGQGTPAPADTIFQVASLTKPIVEMLTLQLVTRGEWNLDEPLANYWVDPDVENDPRHKLLTTRHVLTHQSGFPNWRYLNASNKLEFIADPGTKVNYSGEGLEYQLVALQHVHVDGGIGTACRLDPLCGEPQHPRAIHFPGECAAKRRDDGFGLENRRHQLRAPRVTVTVSGLPSRCTVMGTTSPGLWARSASVIA